MLIAFFAVMLSGCTTDLKVMRWIEKMNVNHPAAVATAMEKLYPNAVTATKYDTTFLKGDSITSFIEVPCPDVLQPKNLHDTIHHVQYVKVPIKLAQEKEIVHQTVFVEDDKKLKILQTKYDVAQDALDFYKPHFWWFVVEHGIVALLAFIYFIAKFYKSSIPKL
jgi:hypothetical protein